MDKEPGRLLVEAGLDTQVSGSFTAIDGDAFLNYRYKKIRVKSVKSVACF
jgi:hypothetical protein